MLNLEFFLKKYFKENNKIILACSTGPDSMFLLYKLLKTSFKNNIVACYFNHKLRKEADTEEEFLKNLGIKLDFIAETNSLDIKKLQKNSTSVSFEEIARQKRYEFLFKVQNKYNSKYILTAHHLDDKIETFLFNLLRGSKLQGFINMTEKSSNILRPLLNLEKNEILKYLDENNLKYFIDKTNFENDITRNFLRNEIIPNFYKVNKKFKNNLKNTLNYFEDLKKFIDDEVKSFLKNKNFFNIKEFNFLSPFLQNEIIRYIFFISNGNSTIGLSEANIREIIKFINGKNDNTKKEIKNLKMNKKGDFVYIS